MEIYFRGNLFSHNSLLYLLYLFVCTSLTLHLVFFSISWGYLAIISVTMVPIHWSLVPVLSIMDILILSRSNNQSSCIFNVSFLPLPYSLSTSSQAQLAIIDDFIVSLRPLTETSNMRVYNFFQYKTLLVASYFLYVYALALFRMQSLLSYFIASHPCPLNSGSDPGQLGRQDFIKRHDRTLLPTGMSPGIKAEFLLRCCTTVYQNVCAIKQGVELSSVLLLHIHSNAVPVCNCIHDAFPKVGSTSSSR